MAVINGKNPQQRHIICPKSLIHIWSEHIDDTTQSRKILPLKSYQQSVIEHFEQNVLLANNQQQVRVSSKNKPATHVPSKPCGYLVWHDMGSGKTIIGIRYLQSEAIKSEDRKHLCTLTDTNTTILTYEDIQKQLQMSRDKCPNFNFDQSRIVFDE